MGSTDFNNNTGASIVARKKTYSDLPLVFSIHPIKKDILPLTDLEAVKQSVKNLILTNNYDVPFQPEIGSNVVALLFETVDGITALAIRDAIVSTLRRWEPRIGNVVVQVFDDHERNGYIVNIGFTVLYNLTTSQTSFFLSRAR